MLTSDPVLPHFRPFLPLFSRAGLEAAAQADAQGYLQRERPRPDHLLELQSGGLHIRLRREL